MTHSHHTETTQQRRKHSREGGRKRSQGGLSRGEGRRKRGGGTTEGQRGGGGHALWFKLKGLGDLCSKCTWEVHGRVPGVGEERARSVRRLGVRTLRLPSGAWPLRWSRGASPRGLVFCLETLNLRVARLPGAKLKESAKWARPLEETCGGWSGESSGVAPREESRLRGERTSSGSAVGDVWRRSGSEWDPPTGSVWGIRVAHEVLWGSEMARGGRRGRPGLRGRGPWDRGSDASRDRPPDGRRDFTSWRSSACILRERTSCTGVVQ